MAEAASRSLEGSILLGVTEASQLMPKHGVSVTPSRCSILSVPLHARDDASGYTPA